MSNTRNPFDKDGDINYARTEEENLQIAVEALHLCKKLLSVGLFPGTMSKDIYTCQQFLGQLILQQQSPANPNDVQDSLQHNTGKTYAAR